MAPALPHDGAVGLEPHGGPYYDVVAAGAKTMGMSAQELQPDVLGFPHFVVDERVHTFGRIEPPGVWKYSIAAGWGDGILDKHTVAVLAGHENKVPSN